MKTDKGERHAKSRIKGQEAAETDKEINKHRRKCKEKV